MGQTGELHRKVVRVLIGAQILGGVGLGVAGDEIEDARDVARDSAE